MKDTIWHWIAVGIIALIGLIVLSSCGTTPDQRDDVFQYLTEIIESLPTPTPTPEPTAVPEPTPAPPPQDGKHSLEGSQRLLVKPASDNTGNLVILLPSKWNNSFRDVWIEANGTRYNDTGRRNVNGVGTYNSNGNRRHIWFNQSGASIGNGVLVVTLEDGVRRLPRNFGVRTEIVER